MKIDLQGASNTRDLGGIQTPYGKVKCGKLLRSGELSRLTQQDVQTLAKIPLNRIVDLRTAAEMQNCADAHIPGVEVVNVSIIRSTTFGITFESASGQEIAAKMDAGLRRMQERGETYLEHMEILYRKFVNDDYCRNGYGEFLKLMATNPTEGATLWHCSVGKDRCGTCTALLLHCLGASRQQIMDDYMLTNTQMSDARNQVMERAQAHAPAEYLPMLIKMMTASQDYLQAFWKEIDTQYGGTDNFLKECGVTDEHIAMLRKNYLEK